MITFITPTYSRDDAVLRRCLDCVEGQTFRDWTHLVIVDDKAVEPHVTTETLNAYSHSRRQFIALGHRSNNYGNTPRQLGIDLATTKYIVFLDDDNVIFPNYCRVMLDALGATPSAAKGTGESQPTVTDATATTTSDRSAADVQMVVCRIIHMGPLPSWLCPPPKVLDGNPPVLQNIDTLQVCVESSVAKQIGWFEMGYMADGHTLQAYARSCGTKHIDDILGVHM